MIKEFARVMAISWSSLHTVLSLRWLALSLVVIRVPSGERSILGPLQVAAPNSYLTSLGIHLPLVALIRTR